MPIKGDLHFCLILCIYVQTKGSGSASLCAILQYMKILATADIHMGRIPSVPDSTRYRGSSSFEAVVTKAIDLQVDVLLLLGDVVEQPKAWLSVYGPLNHGLEQLKQAEIQVIGVGGNHDYSVFPRLAKDNDAIRLLGLGGKWEVFSYKGVQFVGWSFPNEHVMDNPFNTFNEVSPHLDGLSLGLLHTDVTGEHSKYATTRKTDFQQSGVPLWMLGHIHQRMKLQTTEAYYCGSPYALDSSETGEHGVYLLQTVADAYWKEPEFIPLCPHRFEWFDVDVTDAPSIQEIQDRVTKSARTRASSCSFLEELYLKPRFIGALEPSLEIHKVFHSWEDSLLGTMIHEGKTVHILDSWQDETTSKLDLVELSKASGALGHLASLIMNEAAIDALSEKYKDLDARSFNSTAFSLLENYQLDDSAYRNQTKKVAMQLLSVLAGQLKKDMP